MKGGERNFAIICDIGEVRNKGKVRSVRKIGISVKLGNKGNENYKKNRQDRVNRNYSKYLENKEHSE